MLIFIYVKKHSVHIVFPMVRKRGILGIICSTSNTDLVTESFVSGRSLTTDFITGSYP
jgi:hypothetical protein